jgi:cyclopropane fatty-acyl-phospholipid synthase-like methyltransferase
LTKKNKNKIIFEELSKKYSVNDKSIVLGEQLFYEYINDAKHLSFSLARYKFIAKMFEDYNFVLEVGAGEGFKSNIVNQAVKSLTLSDYHDRFLKNYQFNNKYLVIDFLKKKLKKKYDGIYALDVLEHIDKRKEEKFLKNILNSLKKNGTLILGIPSLESQKYASKISKLGHINCKNKKEFKKTMLKYFNNVFMFSMNDEVLHTGYDKMSQYIFAVCVNKKIK